jgi:hypothetical protein
MEIRTEGEFKMKRITLAIGTVAVGLATSIGTANAQVPAPPRPEINPPRQPLPQAKQYPEAVPVQRPGYSLYGGEDQYPSRQSVTPPHFSPVDKIPGIPDEITAANKAREARRNAAVEFGMFRRQFVGSTEFWMDYDRTRLAKVRYSMDELMWHSIHPDYDWGDGGYMYNTAASVGGPQWSGSTERVIVAPPVASPTTRTPHVVRVTPEPVRENVAPATQPAGAVAPPMVAKE